MPYAAVYNESSGAISHMVGAPSNLLDMQAGTGQSWVEADDGVLDTTHYVENGQLVEKQPLNTSHTVSGLEVTFSDLPAGVRIAVEGQSVVAEGQGDSVEFDLPGTYVIELRGSAPHLDQTLEVTVV